MVEVDTLRSKHSAVYAAASIIVGFVIFILVTGVDVSGFENVTRVC